MKTVDHFKAAYNSDEVVLYPCSCKTANFEIRNGKIVTDVNATILKALTRYRDNHRTEVLSDLAEILKPLGSTISGDCTQLAIPRQIVVELRKDWTYEVRRVGRGNSYMYSTTPFTDEIIDVIIDQIAIKSV